MERLEEGAVDRATVYPRRVVEAALRRGAAAIVLAHDHPNGDPAPSRHDKTLTRAVVLAAETVHVRVVDHLNRRRRAGLQLPPGEPAVTAAPGILTRRAELRAVVPDPAGHVTVAPAS